MSENTTAANNKPVAERPEFKNISLTDLPGYRLPPAAKVSILHRISGVMMFVLLPLVIWLFDNSLTSESTYDALMAYLDMSWLGLPVLKLVCFALIWAYLHHFIAGVRHLYMDATHSVTKEFGKSSAIAVLALSLTLTALLGARLFGLF